MAKKGLLTKADYLDIEQYRAVLKKLHDDKDYIDELYFVVAFSTALRISDLLKLKWNNILDRDNLTVTEQKTGKNRMVRFNANVQLKIKELYNLLHQPDKRYYLFKNSSYSNIEAQTINKRLKVIKDRYSLRIGNFSSHTFRKTFGRYVYETSGKNENALLLLCSIFHHSNPAITIRYIGLRDDEICSVFDSIEF